MEATPQPDPSPTAASRRRSGRVSRKPELLVDQIGASNAIKRKRASAAGEVDDADDAEEDDDDDEPDEDDQSDDPEDLDAADGVPPKPRRKRAKSGATARPRAKRPKQNGDAVNLVMRPAKSQRSKTRPKKAARFTDAANVGGLYCSLSDSKTWYSRLPASS